MDKQATLAALETRCFNARVPMYQVCQRASVAQSTIARWRKDASKMTAGPLDRLERALTAIEAERRA